MNSRPDTHLNPCGKYLLLAVATIALTYPSAFAQKKRTPPKPQPPPAAPANTPHIRFEVISIRPSKRGLFGGTSPQRETTETQPDGYIAIDQPLSSTINFAYLPLTYSWTSDSAPMNEPSWAHDEYDIRAKVAPTDIAAWQKQSAKKELLSAALRSLLEERCKIAVHWVPGQTSGYALVAKHGAKLKPSLPGEPIPPHALPLRIGLVQIPGAVYFPIPRNDPRRESHIYNVSMEALAGWLSQIAEAPIVDQTGITGNYDLVMRALSKEEIAAGVPGPLNGYDLDAMGLKLMPVKVPTKRLVVDHIEKPSEN